VQIDDGASVPARTVIVATGAEYRRPALANLAQFEGAGVYYGATFVESQLCSREDVIVVGGGNAAGQAAVFLAQSASQVHVLVRSDGLAASMSRYLIRRIEEIPRLCCTLTPISWRSRATLTWNAYAGETTSPEWSTVTPSGMCSS
jgi:thioredoxin reductase (NADPH)